MPGRGVALGGATVVGAAAVESIPVSTAGVKVGINVGRAVRVGRGVGDTVPAIEIAFREDALPQMYALIEQQEQSKQATRNSVNCTPSQDIGRPSPIGITILSSPNRRDRVDTYRSSRYIPCALLIRQLRINTR